MTHREQGLILGLAGIVRNGAGSLPFGSPWKRPSRWDDHSAGNEIARQFAVEVRKRGLGCETPDRAPSQASLEAPVASLAGIGGVGEPTWASLGDLDVGPIHPVDRAIQKKSAIVQRQPGSDLVVPERVGIELARN